MILRTKIKLAVVMIAIIPTAGMCVIGYWSSLAILRHGLQERVQALAAAVAAGVEPEMIAAVGESHDINSPQYEHLEEMIHSVTAENQRGDDPIRFVYLLTPTHQGATSGWDYAVDSDPRQSKAWSAPGTPYDPTHTDRKGVVISSDRPSFDYVHDQQGEWLSGFAPIHSANGGVVGLAAADIPYQDIVNQADHFFELALALAVLCAGAVGFAADRMINRLTAPVGEIRTFIRTVGEGEFSRRLEKPANGEIAEVVGELNEMASKLEGRERLAKENLTLAKNVTRQADQLAAIAQIDLELNKIQDIDILMERILGEARRLIGCDAGSVMLREGDNLLLTYVQNDTLNNKMPLGQRFSAKSVRIPVGGGSISGYAAMTGESVVVDDAYEIPADRPFHFNKAVDQTLGYRTRSVLAVPLRTSTGKNVGVLQLLNPLDENGAPRANFSRSDVEAIQHFASAATVALERAALTRSLVNRMIKMAELRDPSETGPHVDRVAAYSVILYEGWAKRHGVQGHAMEHERDVLRIAARLHDVGKVAIPDAILKKPGRLTADEYSVMQEHTVYGAGLFRDRDSVLDRAAIDVTLHHHERWDGGGYPGDRDGEYLAKAGGSVGLAGNTMKGETIPLFARIVSVADVYDALSSKRQYKEAWPEERVLAEMKVNAGRQFDPELIEILFEQLAEIRLAAARYGAGATEDPVVTSAKSTTVESTTGES